jgi:hypothetical protein
MIKIPITDAGCHIREEANEVHDCRDLAANLPRETLWDNPQRWDLVRRMGGGVLCRYPSSSELMGIALLHQSYEAPTRNNPAACLVPLISSNTISSTD